MKKVYRVSTTGSPAHAGIDLYAVASHSVVLWFPRTRGDKTLQKEAYPGPLARFPPHTRG